MVALIFGKTVMQSLNLLFGDQCLLPATIDKLFIPPLTAPSPTLCTLANFVSILVANCCQKYKKFDQNRLIYHWGVWKGRDCGKHLRYFLIGEARSRFWCWDLIIKCVPAFHLF